MWNLYPPHMASVDDLDVFENNLYKWFLTEHANKFLVQIDL